MFYIHRCYILIYTACCAQEIDQQEEKYEKLKEEAAKEDEELAEIDKPPKTDEFWFVFEAQSLYSVRLQCVMYNRNELQRKIEENDIDFVKQTIRSKTVMVDEVCT